MAQETPMNGHEVIYDAVTTARGWPRLPNFGAAASKR
jgi:hypothetical protein